MKKTKRKCFNFFRSYYDVYNMLSDSDKVAFMDALLERQFQGIKPTGLTGMAEFAYVSQTNSIDSQVRGYEDKTNTKLTPTEGASEPPIEPPRQGGQNTPTEQEEVKEEVEVQGKEEEKVQEKEQIDLTRKNSRDTDKEKKIEAFEFWWNAYDKKVDRKKCEKKFLKLTIDEMRQCYEHTKKYVREHDEVQYRRNPLTYLNNENWKEEHLTIKRNGSQKESAVQKAQRFRDIVDQL